MSNIKKLFFLLYFLFSPLQAVEIKKVKESQKDIRKEISNQLNQEYENGAKKTEEEQNQVSKLDFEMLKKSKWGLSVIGPGVNTKMVKITSKDVNKTRDFAENGILDFSVLIGPSYEVTQDFKIALAVGLGTQAGNNAISYVVPAEIDLIYDFGKSYSIFGGYNYSYGGLINDMSIYVGVSFRNVSLRFGYIPYAFVSNNPSKTFGSGVYFGFGGAFF